MKNLTTPMAKADIRREKRSKQTKKTNKSSHPTNWTPTQLQSKMTPYIRI